MKEIRCKSCRSKNLNYINLLCKYDCNGDIYIKCNNSKCREMVNLTKEVQEDMNKNNSNAMSEEVTD